MALRKTPPPQGHMLQRTWVLRVPRCWNLARGPVATQGSFLGSWAQRPRSTGLRAGGDFALWDSAIYTKKLTETGRGQHATHGTPRISATASPVRRSLGTWI